MKQNFREHRPLLYFFALSALLMFFGATNLWAQPQYSNANKIYAYRIQNKDNTGYYIVANGSTLNSNLKTSNTDADVNANTAYWFFISDGASGYNIIQLMSGYGVNYPDMNTNNSVNSGNNDTYRHRITLSTSPSSFRFDANGHILHSSTSVNWELEPDSRNGANLNFWTNMDGNIAKWNYVNSQEIEFQNLLTDFSIAGDDEIDVPGTTQYTHNNSLYSGYFQFTLNSTTYYKTSLTTGATTTQPSGSTDGVTYTWSLEGINSSYATISSDGKITYHDYVPTDQTATIKLTAKHGETTKTVSKQVIFKAPEVDPTSVSATDLTVYVGKSQNAAVTLTPNPCYRHLEFTSNNTGIATVNNDGVVAGVSLGSTTVTVKAYKVGNTDYYSATFNVTVKDKVADPVVTFTPSGTAGATASISCATAEAKLYYTTDGTEPTTSSTLYSSPFNVADGATVKVLAVKDGELWDNSNVVSNTYHDIILATPEISIINGSVTFSSTDEGVTFYYTTNGDAPSTSSTSWNGSPITSGITNEATIKVIAARSDARNSAAASRQYIMASGVSTTTVTLNDYEDHNWKYYTGEDVNVGSTTYKEKYKYIIYSPDPRNVKITYRSYNTANNTIILGTSSVPASSDALKPVVSVADGENQNTFVYYKTLEKFVIGMFTDNADWNGIPDNPNNVNEQYPYLTISNPFSKRPKYGDNYYGFAGWKIISGGDHILEYNDNDVIPLDAIIHFNDLNTGYTPNCTSASIVLEATWKVASVYTGTTTPTSTTFPSTNTYETNFWVLPSNITSNITVFYPCTIMGIDPNGANNNSTSRTLSANLTVGNNAVNSSINNHVKLEWMRIGNVTIDANGNDLTIGRGITSTGTRVGTVQGVNSDRNSVNTVIVESGSFSVIRNNGRNNMDAARDCNIYTILGCDYDRSRADYFVNDPSSNPYNTKLTATQIRGSAGGQDLHRDAGELYVRTTVKSGTFMTKVGDEEYYFHAYQHLGQRCMEFQGGYLKSGIKGGSERGDSDTFEQTGKRSMTIRIKGNTRIDGQIAGGSTARPCSGDRVFAITGGRILGWIAPGSNCSTNTEGLGATDGESYVYFGGNARIDSRQFGNAGTNIIGHSTGGVIYGAGLGTSRNRTTIGQMSQGTNIVLADNAYTERGIYGGGAMGTTLATANIFILGGRVGTGVGTVKDEALSSGNQNVQVPAGVFGGACNVGGENSFIYMNGGLVESGIYGGSNNIGNMSGNATVQINGGSVGKDASHTANVHGGGYGNATRVLGSVNVTVGKSGATDGATIYGDVYGGSAEGKTNGNDARTTDAVTNVTLNAGTVNGNVYGGGLGTSTYSADVWGPVTVTVNGGEAQNIFGCNNTNGVPKNTVDVNMTGGLVHECVYGGGNAAAYTAPANETLDVTISGGEVKKNVFGGGLGASAKVTGTTNVKVKGSSTKVDGNVYGGGSAADVDGSTKVTIGE